MNAPFLVPTNTRTLLILLFAQRIRRTSGRNQDFCFEILGGTQPLRSFFEENLTPSRLRQGFRRRQGYGGQVVGQGRKGAKTDLKQKLAKEAKVRRVRAASHFLRDTTGWRSRVETGAFFAMVSFVKGSGGEKNAGDDVTASIEA